jgi:glycosyltransferase involved in cell wall biosynthesis
MSPVVSIIIPNKNRCEELVHTLASVREQTLGDFECVVVDDNSTDDSDNVVRPFLADPRFKLIKQPRDRSGAPAARNEGLAAARGRYVLFLDSDDLLAPHCLAQRVDAMSRRPELDFLVFPCEMFRATPGDVGLLWNADTGDDDLDRFLRHDVPWQTTGPIWRRDALDKVGRWDESAKSAQDWEFHIRAIVAGLCYDRATADRPIDLYWRMASADRASIGKSSVMDKSYHPARLALWRRMYAHVAGAGRMTDFRRRCFVGMYFTACEQIGLKVGRRDARRAWSAALQDKLLSRRQWWQGWLLLAQMKWPARYQRAKDAMKHKWPAEYFLPRSATFMKTPVGRQQRAPSLASSRNNTGDSRGSHIAEVA